MDNTRLDQGILGIDAGGTFTDLAFISGTELDVEAWAKTPTRHNDLLSTIEDGLKEILEKIEPERIKGVNLATTLATNAIVENKIRPTGLILIGYDADQVETALKLNKFGTKHVLAVAGGHDPKGNEAAPLDVEKIEKNIDAMRSLVESFAVSAYFSVRNPSHEVRAREIIKKKFPEVCVTCGHELASDLDAVLRATTATLNSGLIPILINLLESVEKIFQNHGISVPISIVRSDGSLVGAEWAKEHPIETILSGPAASSIGAFFLAKSAECKDPSWVVDVGGTTTDIIYLDENGKPGLGTEGTTVGDHKTLIKSIDIYTFGLGGDSRVAFGNDAKLTVGPRRVKSMCSTVSEIPESAECLRHLSNLNYAIEPIVIREVCGEKAQTSFEQKIADKLKNGCSTADIILSEERLFKSAYVDVEDMETKGIVEFSGFTPTDALHVLGKLDKWDANASRQAAKVLLQGRTMNQDINAISLAVCDKVAHDIALNVLRKSLLRAKFSIKRHGEAENLIDYGLRDSKPSGAPDVKVDLNAAVIGAGAPTWAFIDKVGALLGAKKTILPEFAQVAGAVGSAVGTFSLRYSVWITPMVTGEYRVHLPSGIKDYSSLNEAVTMASAYMQPWITERAKKSGAKTPVINMKQEDEEAWVQGGLRKVHLWTQLLFNVVDDSE